MNGISYQSDTTSKHTLGKVSRRNFGRTKGSTSTALYNMLYRKRTPKGMIISKEFSYKQNISNLYIEKYKHSTGSNHVLSASQALGDIFPQEFEIIQNQYKTEITNLISSLIEPNNFIYKNKYTEKMVKYLIQNKGFIKDMFTGEVQGIIKNSNAEASGFSGEINKEKTSSIRLQQLYDKFSIPENTTIKNNKIFSLENLRNYKLYNCIENIIFSEFLSQHIGIDGSNNLLIDNQSYHIYISSIKNDIFDGIDLILEDERKNYIGIDITLNKTKKSGLKNIDRDFLKATFIANHFPIRKEFRKFYNQYIKYIYENGPQPGSSGGKNIDKIHYRLASILHYQNNTPSSPDQDIDNSVVMDLGETDHTQHNETV